MQLTHAIRTPEPRSESQFRRLVDALRPHRPLLSILALGLAVRVLLVAATTAVGLHIADERQYAALGTSLLHGDGFAWGPDQPTSMRPPLYPALLALVWTAAGHESASAVRGLQVMLSLLTVAGVYLLALRLFNRRVATAAACILCFYPSFLFAGVLLLTEVLFALLLVALVLQYDALMSRPAATLAAAMGATLGLAALTRSVLWPFPLLLVPLVAASIRASLSRRLVIGACCAAGFLAIVGPWAARNIRLQHTFTVVDTMGGMNLLMGNYEHTPEDRMWDAVALLEGDKSWSRNLSQTHPESTQWTDGQKEKWAQREAIAYMTAHPVTTVRRMVLKFADFWGLEREMVAWFERGVSNPSPWLMWPAVLAAALAYPVVAIGAAIGISRASLTNWRTHVLIVTVVAFVAGVHTVVFGHSRYHLPLVPFLAVYAAAAWVGWRSGELSPGRGRVALAGLLSTGLASIWCYEVLVRDAARLRALVGL